MDEDEVAFESDLHRLDVLSHLYAFRRGFDAREFVSSMRRGEPSGRPRYSGAPFLLIGLMSMLTSPFENASASFVELRFARGDCESLIGIPFFQ
jgi:hypothetical protein